MNNGKEMLKKATDAMHVENLIKGKPCPKCGDKMDKMGCIKMGCGGMKKAEKCPKCKKEDCVCKAKQKCPHCDGDAPRSKCICGQAKKADKKPAHGMVIVIGSKAGPGPSKDGKREKLDSEKKD